MTSPTVFLQTEATRIIYPQLPITPAIIMGGNRRHISPSLTECLLVSPEIDRKVVRKQLLVSVSCVGRPRWYGLACGSDRHVKK